MASKISAASVLLFATRVLGGFSINGLAETPQMGWDNWNAYGCDVSADLLVNTANRMSEIGLKDAGYQYVILDDCWSNGRYANGTLKPNFVKFPQGMKAVGDDIHALGMKFGMYSDAGLYTCGQYAGSLYHETMDATTFASWGVDYLKYDNCFNAGQSGTALNSFNRYNIMSRALNATGRPILYSMCNWGEDGPWNWASTIANSWRATGDVFDSFDRPDSRCPCTTYDCALPGYHCSIMNILGKIAPVLQKSQPGAWNDLDMLEVGNGGMTDDEYKVMFTLWAAVKSPLLIGTNVVSLSASSYSIYANPAIIALNQDPDGTPVSQLWNYQVADTDQYGMGSISMWAGALYGGDMAVILLNAGNANRTMNATLAQIFVDDGGAIAPEAMLNYDVYDLWANRMPNATANMILENNSTVGVANVTDYWYNATATSYEEGIMANNSLLMGTKVGSVQAMGTLEAMVPRHGVMAFRLKPQASTMAKRDEL